MHVRHVKYQDLNLTDDDLNLIQYDYLRLTGASIGDGATNKYGMRSWFWLQNNDKKSIVLEVNLCKKMEMEERKRLNMVTCTLYFTITL